MLGASHLDAVKALRSSPDKVSITVCDGYDPKDVMRRKSEAEAMASSRAEKSEWGRWSGGHGSEAVTAW